MLTILWPWLAAASSGLLLALCYAPWEWGHLVWVWSFPLLSALWFSRPARETRKSILGRSFLLGYLCGFVFFLVNSHWIYHTGKVVESFWAGVGAVLGMGLYLGLYIGLFGMFAATVGKLDLSSPERKAKQNRRKSRFSHVSKKIDDLFGQSLHVLAVAFLNGAFWCGMEWLRSVAFTGYSWNGLGVALKNHLTLIQFADVIGANGYGFVVMFAGVVGFATILRFAGEIRSQNRMRPHLDFAVAIGMIIGIFLYGFGKMTDPPEETIDIRARIMQLNHPIKDKYNPDENVRRNIIFEYRDLTRTFLDHGDYDLVLWPETSIPTVFSWRSTMEFLDEEVLKGEDFYLLIGIEDNDVERRLFNTITMMRGKAESFQMYSKIHLVPFGEFVPGRDWKFPVFEWIFGKIITQDFTRGTSYENLIMEKDGTEIAIIPLVCFEDTVARHARKFVRDMPQFMVNVTNDAWFYDSAEPHQHFANALFRCIELRRPMIRAANTGVSGFIDEFGNVYDRDAKEPFKRIVQDEETGNTFIRGSLPATLKVDRDPPMTIYARIGDSFSFLLGLSVSVLFVFRLIRWRD